MKDIYLSRIVIAISISCVASVTSLSQMALAKISDVNLSSEKNALIHQKERLRPGDIVAWSTEKDILDIPESARHDLNQVTSNLSAALALKNDGTTVAWGKNINGITQIPDEARGSIKQISASMGTFLALTDSGKVIQWGNVKTEIPDVLQSGVSKVAASRLSSNMLALKDGGVILWGEDENKPELQIPESAKSNVINISVGRETMFAIKENGDVIAWGSPGSTSKIPVSALHNAREVIPTLFGGYTLKRDGTITGWYNYDTAERNAVIEKLPASIEITDEWKKQVIDGTYAMENTIPEAAKQGVKQISANLFSTLALKTNGEIIAWGRGMASSVTGPSTMLHPVSYISNTGESTLVILGEGNDILRMPPPVVTTPSDNEKQPGVIRFAGTADKNHIAGVEVVNLGTDLDSVSDDKAVWRFPLSVNNSNGEWSSDAFLGSDEKPESVQWPGGEHTVSVIGVEADGRRTQPEKIRFSTYAAPVLTSPVLSEPQPSTVHLKGTTEKGIQAVRIAAERGPTLFPPENDPGDVDSIEWFSVSVGKDGTWSATLPGKLMWGNYFIWLKGELPGSQWTSITEIFPLIVDSFMPEVYFPAEGSTVSSTRPVIGGTGLPGVTVNITENGKHIGRAIVDKEGDWSVTSEESLAPGMHTLNITQSGAGIGTSSPFKLTFRVPEAGVGDVVINVPSVITSTEADRGFEVSYSAPENKDVWLFTQVRNPKSGGWGSFGYYQKIAAGTSGKVNAVINKKWHPLGGVFRVGLSDNVETTSSVKLEGKAPLITVKP
ncbi:hypothetical protein [Enterobacter bugandensis]|nr:hypothetical protein [Enterobacter bugandensis]